MAISCVYQSKSILGLSQVPLRWDSLPSLQPSSQCLCHDSDGTYDRSGFDIPFSSRISLVQADGEGLALNLATLSERVCRDV